MSLAPIILVDMDNTILDFTARVEEIWLEKYPDKPPPSTYTKWRFNEDYELLYPGASEEVMSMYQGIDCFNKANPICGAVKALHEMVANGYNVFICTTPVANYEYCVRDKYYWVEKHLGKDWIQRLILTRDKTIVSGSVLIDDKPEITGLLSLPSWKHVLFTRPYNTNLDKERLTDWANWKQIVPKI